MPNDRNRSSSLTLVFKLTVLVVSSLMMLLFAELALTIYEERQVADKSGASDTSFDRRTRLEVIHDLAEQGITAYPPLAIRDLFDGDEMIFDLEVEVDGDGEGRPLLPLIGISEVVTVTCNETGEYLVYPSDEYGFHNPKGVHGRPTPPLVAIGDSFTAGACVKSEENAVAQLARRHPGTVNLGRGGNGPLINLATLKEYGAPLAPEAVVWLHFEDNDLVNLEWEKQVAILRRYLEPGFSQGLRAHREPLDRALESFIRARQAEAEAYASRSELAKLLSLERLRARVERVQTQWTQAAPPDYALLREIFAAARATTDTWGARLYFAYLPTSAVIRGSKDYEPQRRRVLEIVAELGIPAVDLTDAFLSHPSPNELFPLGRPYGHYNARGYALVAEKIDALISTRPD